MAGPVKRSVAIAGHATSITLEPVFWEALVATAAADGVPLAALVARIDADRVAAPDPPNLASAIRVWLFERARAGATMTADPPPEPYPNTPDRAAIISAGHKP